MTENQEANFWRKVVVVESCWEWCGRTDRDGYGEMDVPGTTARAHRISYEHYVGAIPAGMTLDHLCRNRRCVKPSHLEAVTLKENVLRGFGCGANNARKTHCLRGHSLAIYGKRQRTGRYCWACWLIKNGRGGEL